MNTKTFACFSLLISLFSNVIPALPQQATAVNTIAYDGDAATRYTIIETQMGGSEYAAVLEKLFGADAEAAAAAFSQDSAALFNEVTSAAGQQAEESLEQTITERRKSSRASAVNDPVSSFVKPDSLDWRQFAFGFMPLDSQDVGPDIKVASTDKEIRAEGTDKKTYETKDAKGTRTQKVETKYTKDGKTFGVEIKDTQVIDAVSKPDGKSFRRELSIVWGADVDACPDANGISAGTGKAKVVSKTTYVENGSAVTMISDFDLQAKLAGSVNDEAVLTHYDMQIDAYTTNSGYENALSRDVIKEVKIKDGRYGVRYTIPGNTIEISDGQYGGDRTPAKSGKATARTITQMASTDAATVVAAIDKMVPTIWNSANDMYKTAEKHWRNNGCVEVVASAAKLLLEQGEDVTVTAETAHLQDRTKINAQFSAEGYYGAISPESQKGAPRASFTFTQEGENNGIATIRSVSKRGIGETDIDFQLKKKKEENTEAGIWTGTITAVRKYREEKEKRSGSNLSENGGNTEVTTDIRLELTGRLDRTVDASNAYIANISGNQETVDFEYDRYKIDEGYCGPNAVPYKGAKELTRTSTTIAAYAKDTRVFLEIGSGGGTASFSLPETNGTTIHKYVHRSPCAEHDRANTTESSDEDTPTLGGSFAFSFPVPSDQKTFRGTITINGEDDSVTVYRWELTRQ